MRCKATDCGKPARTKGYCNGCYLRWQRAGFPVEGPPESKSKRDSFFNVRRQWMFDEQGLSYCWICEKWMAPEKFSLSNEGIGGRYAWCKACSADRNQLQGDGLPDGWTKSDADKLRRRYSITPWEYLGLLYAQGGCCYICKYIPSNAKGDRLVVDHDHSCCADEYTCGNCIRGLLCNSCNWTEGHLRKVIERGGKLAAIDLVQLATA